MENIRIRDRIRYTGLECLPAVLKVGGSNPGRDISVSGALVKNRDIFDQDQGFGSGFGSMRAKMTHKSRKKILTFMF
jgi:hypothetical protein